MMVDEGLSCNIWIRHHGRHCSYARIRSPTAAPTFSKTRQRLTASSETSLLRTLTGARERSWPSLTWARQEKPRWPTAMRWDSVPELWCRCQRLALLPGLTLFLFRKRQHVAHRHSTKGTLVVSAPINKSEKESPMSTSHSHAE